jgi:phosphoribosylformylglycinamidine synthase
MNLSDIQYFNTPEKKWYNEVYVAKKQELVNVEKWLELIIAEELKIPWVKARVYSNYVADGVDDQAFSKWVPTIFAELPVDEVMSKWEFEKVSTNKTVLRIEAKPGQYDQRVDGINKSFQLDGVPHANIRYIRTVVLEKNGKPLSTEESAKVEAYLRNIVEEMSLTEWEKYSKLLSNKSPEWYEIVGGFRTISSTGLEKFAKDKWIMIALDDLLFIQEHYKKLRRDPSIAELKVLMTYWSDHCRHTTFNTKLENITVTGDEAVSNDINTTLAILQGAREKLGKWDKDLTLMNIVTIPPQILKQNGIESLQKLDESEEINAFTYKTTIELEDGRTEEYLVMFKNETHNSPTQAAPFGGAATCIGWAIRDNLSARGYTFYAMRTSGSADPTEPIDAKTIWALSQRFISQFSALGHASYGNQIGIANGHVREFFSPGYRAKHMEVGYVLAYAPQDAVVRSEPKKWDLIVQFGWLLGRDGVAWAAVSSSSGGTHSAETVGSHVQKWNAVVEASIQALILDTAFTRLIKRCNDFGAGGISVAAWEIAPGVDIRLDKQKTKYAGLNEWEKAIAESQERMAIVIDPKDWKEMYRIAAKHNLVLTKVGKVTSGEKWKWQVRMFDGKRKVVDISREFIESAGAPKIQDGVEIEAKSGKDLFLPFWEEITDPRERFLMSLGRKEVSLQKWLESQFDNSVWAGTLFAPYGGKNQLSPQIWGVALFPTYNRNIDGKDQNPHAMISVIAVANAMGVALPVLEKNSYIGAMYSIIDFVSKLVAIWVKKNDIYYGLQEYFESLWKDSKRWGKITAMLLGAWRTMMELEIAAIGGKDSASGTGKDNDGERVDVPPTLIAMGNGVVHRDRARSAEFKPIWDIYLLWNKVAYYEVPRDADGLPDWEAYNTILATIEKMHDAWSIVSSSTVWQGGVAATIARMTLGNDIGFRFNTDNFTSDQLYVDDFGGIVLEVEKGTDIDQSRYLGMTQSDPNIIFGDTEISTEDSKNALMKTLEPVYSTESSGWAVEAILEYTGKAHEIISSPESANIITNQPRVLIPVFPGTNSHRDTEQWLRRAGFTNITTFVFRDTTPAVIMESAKLFALALKDTNVTVFSGGFSAGDEPDGSAKYSAMMMRMSIIKDILQDFIDKSDTLTLGICNGFQLLIKLGLFSESAPVINDYLKSGDMTLAHNTNLRHITDMVGLKVTSIKSPWMSTVKIGDTYVLPVSHGEWRLLASELQIAQMIRDGQIALQYLDNNGNPTNEQNGSVRWIAALTSRDGRIMWLMPHPERAYEFLWKNIPGNHMFPVFEWAAYAFGVKSAYQRSEGGILIRKSA